MNDFKAFKSGSEKELMDTFHLPSEQFPYPLRTVESKIFGTVTVYDIPECDKGKMLKLMYPFYPLPKMNGYYFDIHQNEKFKVSDFLIIRDGGKNYLVSPYYPESGGMAVDWLDVRRAEAFEEHELNSKYGTIPLYAEDNKVEIFNMPDTERIPLLKDVLSEYGKFRENAIFYDTGALRCFSWQDFKIDADEEGKGLVSPFFEDSGSLFNDCALVSEEFCNSETLAVNTKNANEALLPYSIHVQPMERKGDFYDYPGELFEYIIPDKDRQSVLEALFPFRPIPDFDSEVTDAYLARKFIFRDCIVVRLCSRNVILTPFFNDIGAISM